MLDTIRNAIAGKKTYILGCVAVATSLVMWSTGEISLTNFAMAIFVALQTMFVRAGIKKAEFGIDTFDTFKED